ncbi:MAG TPA: hypothetical protein VHM00_12425 [Caldimonas sp.]|jgi:hypothetical protein|nr:hypothetical protein [Caldimonas sp.]HEX2541874.1 hypothetical protein [Caldimonas sp.]
MISRLTACAAIFAVLATTGFAVAAERKGHAAAMVRAASAEPMPVIVLPRVEVTGKRTPGR